MLLSSYLSHGPLARSPPSALRCPRRLNPNVAAHAERDWTKEEREGVKYVESALKRRPRTTNRRRGIVFRNYKWVSGRADGEIDGLDKNECCVACGEVMILACGTSQLVNSLFWSHYFKRIGKSIFWFNIHSMHWSGPKLIIALIPRFAGSHPAGRS